MFSLQIKLNSLFSFLFKEKGNAGGRFFIDFIHKRTTKIDIVPRDENTKGEKKNYQKDAAFCGARSFFSFFLPIELYYYYDFYFFLFSPVYSYLISILFVLQTVGEKRFIVCLKCVIVK